MDCLGMGGVGLGNKAHPLVAGDLHRLGDLRASPVIEWPGDISLLSMGIALSKAETKEKIQYISFWLDLQRSQPSRIFWLFGWASSPTAHQAAASQNE